MLAETQDVNNTGRLSPGDISSELQMWLLGVWVVASGDPGAHILKWFKAGAPAGLENNATADGIFPPSCGHDTILT